jgi:hypothetical protein
MKYVSVKAFRRNKSFMSFQRWGVAFMWVAALRQCSMLQLGMPVVFATSQFLVVL